ncbi:MAG: 1-(5-phosphoribosyl)-5-[(5-phosphoribosylamino)methylideneamino]imidazole-4-carboxamide isomerase [Cytophagaceae bacterium]|jgi:phosphoribosylformimino-5-aminoimidazole carboxamide ribotide isomerase|nr:1-(5-phosphoribosyl)-5-[(5-phosphoribosylamino)methylideneamino]imidazole-4-carboxamide isomerase [Cytophagaceae bacterium]
MEIIPAIDLIGGKCVRLTQGDYNQKKEYSSDPLEVAKRFEGAGIRRLHLVDLDGAKQKKIINHEVLRRIATQTSLHVDFGGGIQSDEDIALAFDCGARQITGGSIAVRNEALLLSWIERYGPEKIILGADCINEMVAVSGWQETSTLSVFDLIEKYLRAGIRYCICTDVSKDGLLQGPSVALYKKILERFPALELIASGGVSQVNDLHALQELKVFGAIVGKAYYEDRISLQELASFQ